MKSKLLILLSVCAFQVKAQIITAVTKANFGVDADLRANYFNGSASGAGDDWFRNSDGAGAQMIDTTGAAAIVAGYLSNVSTRTRTFSRLMKPDPFSLSSNRLVIDAVYHRDYHGDDSTMFSGGNKNGSSPADWNCPIAQGVPDKNELLDVYTHVRRAGPNLRDSMWMFGAVSIENTTGNRYFDFELYQTDIYYDRTTRKFMNYGPQAGHTAWSFDSEGNIRTAGDIIFSAEYSSSELSKLEARIWVHKSALSLVPTQFQWAGEFDGAGTGATYGYASIKPLTAGAFYTGLQSANGTWAGPFSLVLGDNSLTTNYVARQFMEFSVNLSKLGLDPAGYSANACGSPFRRVLIKSRSSTSFSAELKDFVAPFRLFDYPSVDAWTDIIYFCGTMPTVSINVLNPNSASTYTWSTTNGNISGSTTGTSIQVNAPGTYYVNHQLHSSCPVYSRDSVKIMFDAQCVILDAMLKSINASGSVADPTIQWQIQNNEYAKSFQIEYSTDGASFHHAGAMDANSHPGTESYSFRYNGHQLNTRVLYFRIRVKSISGREVISRIVAITNNAFNVAIIPNPSNGNFNLTSSDAMIRKVIIIDATGRKLYSQYPVKSSSNVDVQTENLLPAGSYFLQAETEKGNITIPLIIKK